MLAVRTHAHAELEEWAEWASIPVINALTADEHPCQALADALTIRDRLGSLDGVRVALGRRRLERARLARRARRAARLRGRRRVPGRLRAVSANLALTVVRDPREAVRGADVVVTDTWISMGQEHERAERLATLEPYRLDEALLAEASPDAFVMHCLPAHPGEEIDGERALRRALGDLGRGREPPARAEGAARARPRRLSGPRERRERRLVHAGLGLEAGLPAADRGSSRIRNQSSIVTRGLARASATACVRYRACFAGETPRPLSGGLVW